METVPGGDTLFRTPAASSRGCHTSEPIQKVASCLPPPRSTFLRVSGHLRGLRPADRPGNAPAR
ncbi:hypothetical protein Slala03_70450 [Streptomyces lavendulae subsp. lavendulae]|nr:hypothetical protein Slala03_70450 [Streptomyces lavendulae subsp. lavendulae]